MKIFNIGPLELLLIVTIALIFLGPEGMLNTAKQVSKIIRQLIKSPLWASIMDTSKEIREMPRKLMEETGLDKSFDEITRLKSSAEEEISSIGDHFEGQIEYGLDPIQFPEREIGSLEEPIHPVIADLDSEPDPPIDPEDKL